MKRSGVADLPLHGGRVPHWLAHRMAKLGTAIVESIVIRYGRAEFLSRLSDPFWFQALGAVMGMDWHSSGITTSVMGALKRGLDSRSHELGIYICGGRGRHSRNTPDELRAVSDRCGFDGDALVRTSRLTARIDNNAIADGFQIYLHTFVLTADNQWAVVQQGMNDSTGMARRYHWHSSTVRDFTIAPHTAIVGEHQGEIMNLVDREAKPAQAALLEVAREKPLVTLQQARRLCLPARHEVRASDVDLKRLGGVLAVAYDRQLHDFAELLLLKSWDRARCRRWRSSQKSCTARPSGFPIPRDSPLHSEAKTGSRFQFRSRRMTSPCLFFRTHSMPPSSATPISLAASNACIGLCAPSNVDAGRWRISMPRSPTKKPSPPNSEDAAFLIMATTD